MYHDGMKCKICNRDHGNKVFCSTQCRLAWLKQNNTVNNPIWKKKSLASMRKALTGRTLSKDTRHRMSVRRKEVLRENPDLLDSMLIGAEEKYLSRVRGTSWRMIRLSILQRDRYTCTDCGEKGRNKLLVHHIDWNGKRKSVPVKEWNNQPSNLVTLCYKCHNGIHRHKAKDYQKRLMQK